MKYVRTKNGVYEFPEGFTEFNWNGKTLLENKEHVVWTGGEILAQADTIEELCDGFIFKDTHANELHFLDKNSGISLLGASLFEETLRGFIETNKGLIYVAKMNKKGELELL